MKTIYTCFLLCIVMQIQAQTIDTSVISNAGGTNSNASHIVSFTIGETFVETISTSQSVDQGFWSSVFLENTLSTEEVVSDDDAIAVYPNPVTDFFVIKMHNAENYNFTLYNINGLKVLHQNIDATRQGDRIDMSSLVEGMYMLSLFIPQKDEYKTFKIIKK